MRRRGRYRERWRAVRQEKAHLGRSGQGHAILSVRTAALGEQDRRNRLQRQSLPYPFRPQQSHPIEMAARADHERTENNVCADAALGFVR